MRLYNSAQAGQEQNANETWFAVAFIPVKDLSEKLFGLARELDTKFHVQAAESGGFEVVQLDRTPRRRTKPSSRKRATLRLE